MIKLISNSISEYFGKNNSNLSEKDLLKINYSLQVIMGDISKLIIIFLIFLSIGQLPLFFLSSVFLISTRPLAGGIHCKTYFSCLVCSILYFSVVILYTLLAPKFNVIFYIIFAIVSLMLTALYAPCPNEKRPVKNKTTLKILSLISLIFWFILFFKLSNIQFCNCIFAGIFLQVVQIIYFNIKGVVSNGKIYKHFFSSTAKNL